ncbi:MAG TPA: cyclic 2,3-diphosphoglycerate synthase [candidate division Zixibacteria bacterium]|nr:cyclic 2,3-diphosphoglycerate synthase [candidate division Zixibacteria bacterium]
MTKVKKVLIMGAAGRDFHNFNVVFRNNPRYKVVAFTATQIPNIVDRRYPAKLAGKLYPKGIPIFAEDGLTELIQKHKIEEVVFSYSDVSHEYVMHKGSLAISAGADFKLLGEKSTMLKADIPVIAVCAVRTGSGKSQTTRKVSQILKRLGKKVVVVRHPMPYGDLTKQTCQRFASKKDLDRYNCTIEEREEYEPHLEKGTVVYAGVDYKQILEQAQKEADIIIWDGGNNDFPFFNPDLLITVADPHRAGHELTYFPGEVNLRSAEVVVINKVDTAKPRDVKKVEKNTLSVNPDAIIIKAASPISVDKPDLIRNKRVLVVEDGPTLTHGEMRFGAGIVAAKKYRARRIVDPHNFVVGSFRRVFAHYPNIGPLLPAMGYGEKQIKDLQRTINAANCDSVVIATPIDLGKILKINKPTVRVRYELQEITKPDLTEILKKFINKI